LRLFFCVFDSFVCSVFVLLLYFVLIFYLGLRSFFVFLCVFFTWNECLSSHVAKLSSFDPSQLSSSFEDRCKDHLVVGEGSACLIKKKRKIVDKDFKIRSGLEGSCKMVIVNEPCWFIYRCLKVSVHIDLDMH